MGISVSDPKFKVATLFKKVVLSNSKVLMTEGNEVNNSFAKSNDSAPGTPQSKNLVIQQRDSTFKD